MSEKKGLLSYLTGAEIKQFISYFIVGGVSALVEWISFFLLGRLLNMPYLPATALAFVFSTTTNWFLGRTFTFKNSKLGKKKGKEREHDKFDKLEKQKNRKESSGYTGRSLNSPRQRTEKINKKKHESKA